MVFERLMVTSLPSANLKGHQGWYYNMGYDAYWFIISAFSEKVQKGWLLVYSSDVRFASFSFRLVNTQEHQMNHTNILEELAWMSVWVEYCSWVNLHQKTQTNAVSSLRKDAVDKEPRKRTIGWIKKRLSKQQDLRVSHQEGSMQSTEWRQNVEASIPQN